NLAVGESGLLHCSNFLVVEILPSITADIRGDYRTAKMIRALLRHLGRTNYSNNIIRIAAQLAEIFRRRNGDNLRGSLCRNLSHGKEPAITPNLIKQINVVTEP